MKTLMAYILIVFALSFPLLGQPTPSWHKPKLVPVPATPARSADARVPASGTTTTSAYPAQPFKAKAVAPTTMPDALALLTGALAGKQYCDASLAADTVLTITQAESERKHLEYQGKVDEVARRVATLQNFVRERTRFAELLAADVERIQAESQRVVKQLAQLDDIVKRKQLAPDRVEDLRESLRTEARLLEQQLSNRKEARAHLAEDSQSLDDRLFREDLSRQYWELLVKTAASQTDLWNAAYLKVRDAMEYQCTLQRGTYRRCAECEAGLGSPSPATTRIQPGKEK